MVYLISVTTCFVDFVWANVGTFSIHETSENVVKRWWSMNFHKYLLFWCDFTGILVVLHVATSREWWFICESSQNGRTFRVMIGYDGINFTYQNKQIHVSRRNCWWENHHVHSDWVNAYEHLWCIFHSSKPLPAQSHRVQLQETLRAEKQLQANEVDDERWENSPRG